MVLAILFGESSDRHFPTIFISDEFLELKQVGLLEY